MGQRLLGGQGQRQVLVVAALLAVLLALLATLVAVSGSARFGDARTGGLIDGPLLQGQADDAEAVDDPPPDEPGARPPRWLPVLLVLALSLVLALAVRALSRSADGNRSRDRPAPPVGDAEGDTRAVLLDEVVRTTRAASDELRRGGPGGADLVVRCWEELEELGERLGTPRAPHETPTEYGADLLRRHGADPAAVDLLVHLYHLARFGRGSLPDGTARRAADALARVSDTLGPATDTAGAGRG